MSTKFKPKRTVIASFAIVAALLFSSCELTDQQAQVAHHLNTSRRGALGQNATIGTHWHAQFKAQAWAEKLAAEGTLYHSKLSDGMGTPGVDWCGLGENVGFGPSIKAINDAYMNSPGHRANIVNRNFDSMGVGYAIGYVQGQRVAFTTQVFVQRC